MMGPDPLDTRSFEVGLHEAGSQDAGLAFAGLAAREAMAVLTRTLDAAGF